MKQMRTYSLTLMVLFLGAIATHANATSLLPWKSKYKRRDFHFENKSALIITTSYATLDRIDPNTGEVLEVGKPTGVYPSEMTGPYYEFLDSNINVDIASIKGGEIPIEPILDRRLMRTESDERFLEDSVFQAKVKNSIAIKDIDVSTYDIVFLAGGWGAAYDFAQSQTLADLMSSAYAQNKILGGICHGPLGLLNAIKPDGSRLVDGLKMTAVTDRQIKQLRISKRTPMHPERDLRAANADYQSKRGVPFDFFTTLVVVDGRIVTGQNQKSDIEAAQKMMEILEND